MLKTTLQKPTVTKLASIGFYDSKKDLTFAA
jgi:hypothetical protein